VLQTAAFSIFAAGPASAPTECTMQDIIALRTPGNVEVLVADLDVTHFVGVGTLFEQETGSRWITLNNTFTVHGLAGPPSGQGRWIDLTDVTELTMTVQDADDSNAPIYELRYRFDGDQFTVRSFIQL
jgi:hypothetical protein